MTIGGQLAAAAGPIGVGGAVNTSLINPAPIFTYSKSKGLFAGMSLEGTVLIERVSSTWLRSGRDTDGRNWLQKDANSAFYGQAIAALDLLTYVPSHLIPRELTLTCVSTTAARSLPQRPYVPFPLPLPPPKLTSLAGIRTLRDHRSSRSDRQVRPPSRPSLHRPRRHYRATTLSRQQERRPLQRQWFPLVPFPPVLSRRIPRSRNPLSSNL